MKPLIQLFIGATLLAPSALLAQSNANNAAIEGYIFDSTQKTVADASVKVSEASTKQSYSSRSNSAGYYRLPLLPIGTYNLTVEATGFAGFERKEITLSVGNQARIDATLAVQGTQQSVTVSADAAVIETGALTGNSGVVSEKAVRNLPAISRSIYNFALLNPGVKGVPSPNFGTTLVIFGGNNRANYLTDGVDNNLRLFGAPTRLVISTPEAITESQVLSNNYTAEFGKTVGAILNVVTKSGTNDYHGSAMFLYRPNGLVAAPALSTFKPDSQWKEAAGTLGGAIKKDRLFFFANYEYNPLKTPKVTSINPAVAQALGLPASELNATQESNFNTLSGKVDFRINDRNYGFVRYARFWNDEIQEPGGLSIVSRGNGWTDRMNGGAVQLTSILSNNLLNEFRFGSSARTLFAPPLGHPRPDSFSVDLSGQASIGNNGRNITQLAEKPTQIVDNITWTHGRHTLKFGVDYTHISGFFALPLTQNYTFGGVPAAGGRAALNPVQQYQAVLAHQTDPATGNPFTYTLLLQFLGTPSVTLGFNHFSTFAQDEFRISPKLTLNLGVRYEAYLIPTLDANAPYPLSRQVPNDLGNIAPRIGLAYSPFNNQKTVIRAGFGLYYDPASTNLLQPAVLDGNRVGIYAVPGAVPTAPPFGTLLTAASAAFATAPGISAFSQSYKTLYAQQGTVQIEQALPMGMSLRTGYSMNLQRHLPYQYDINLGNPLRTLADGRPVYGGVGGRPNKQYSAINLIDSGGISNYHGLDITVNKRLAKGLAFGMNYSWSHAIADNTLATGSITDPSNRGRDRGNSPLDVRHSFSFFQVLTPTFTAKEMKWLNGFNLSTTWFYNSGRPINGIAGTDLNNDTVVNDRPLYQGFDSFKGPDFFQLDARLSRRFHITEKQSIEGIFESQNLTNRVNADCSSSCTNAVVSVVPLPDFGRLVAARQGRVVQFGFRYTF